MTSVCFFLLFCSSDYSTIRYDVLEGNSVTLDTGLKKLQKGLTVRWKRGPGFGGEMIANFSGLSPWIEGSSVEDLRLNPLTGSLTIVRVTKIYAGFYCVELLLGDEPYILQRYLVTTYGKCRIIDILHVLPCIPHVKSPQTGFASEKTKQ